jgi:pimeloyl-ACP methyl ester carboxylesterase
MAPRTQNPAPRNVPPTRPPTQRETEDVNPRWILKALGAVILAALICGYLTLCLLFYVGQWQLVLHPARNAKPLAVAGAEMIRFAPDESAVPKLTGWWIPAATGAKYSSTTLLYLPSGDGSLVDAADSVGALHALGVNVFAFDYRGYGQSATTRPNQANLMADAESVFQFLHISRGLAEQQIVPYGVGVGASLAVKLAAEHGKTAAVIVDSPRGDLLATLLKDPRTDLLPARLLFHERFPLADPLASLRTPKLLLLGDKEPDAFSTAASPKITATLRGTAGKLPGDPGFTSSITRFLDQYLPAASVSPLVLPAR